MRGSDRTLRIEPCDGASLRPGEIYAGRQPASELEDATRRLSDGKGFTSNKHSTTISLLIPSHLRIEPCDGEAR
jgi:hypothetical protein